MLIKEIHSRSILSSSKIYEYVINPYVGCQHGCSYCYARFMKRFTHHPEPWGEFVDVKVNAVELLRKEISRKKKGQVWISGVCDPYQPLEEKYKLTMGCLEILVDNDWPVVVQTRSPLAVRDIAIFERAAESSVGFSIATADDKIREIFEPKAPSISERVKALKAIHDAGITTYAMVAPILPGAENIADVLAGIVDYVYVDRMNYHFADKIYKKHGYEKYLENGYFQSIAGEITKTCHRNHIECSVLF